MSCLCSEGCGTQYCKLIRLLCSYPPHTTTFSFLFYPYVFCLSENSICMAKQRFESWLARPHARLTALMSSLRFDDAANKGTGLITWPLNSLPFAPSLLLAFPILFTPPLSPLRWRSENEVTLVWTQTCALSRAAHPWKNRVDDFITSEWGEGRDSYFI